MNAAAVAFSVLKDNFSFSDSQMFISTFRLQPNDIISILNKSADTRPSEILGFALYLVLSPFIVISNTEGMKYVSEMLTSGVSWTSLN